MMKFIYLLLTMLMFTTASCQYAERKKLKEEGAPEAVQKAFEQKYPGENDPDWEIDAHGNYEAHFKKKGEKYRADFTPEGIWVETENDIKKKELPEAIQKVLSEKYFLFEITEVERVDHPTKGIFYDVEFKQKGKNLDIEFTADGTIIN